jgi:outer membrane protein TolC
MSLKHLLKYKPETPDSKGCTGYGKNLIALLYLCFIMLLSINASAQNIVTLKQAISSGLMNKKNVIAGKLDVTVRKLQTQALYRKYWPQVSIEYSYLFNPILQSSILPIGIFNPAYAPDATKSIQFGTKWSQSAGVTANQPLLDLSIQRQINEAKLQERIAALSQAQSEYEFAYTIAQTYIDICLQDSKIRVEIADTNRTYVSYNLLKNKFDEKRLLKSDLNKSKVNHNNAVQLLMDGISQLIEDKVYLLFLIGVSDIGKWDFEIDTNFLMNNPLAKPDISSSFDQLPEMQVLVLQSQLTALQARSEKAKHIPTVSFKGFIGADQYTNTFNPVAANSWFGLSYIGLNAKFPLLIGENQHNKLLELKAQSSQYNLRKEDKTAQYEKDVFIANLRIDNIMMQLKVLEENLSLSIETIGIFQARVIEGQESASTLNSEEASLQIQEAEYENNKKQLWDQRLDYLKASGQLNMLWK